MSAQLLHGYLTLYLLLLQVVLGSMGLLMVYHLTGGRWGEALRPSFEIILRIYPWLALLFIPILLSVPHLYPWASTPDAAHPVYLSIWFFALRSVIYLGAWYFLSRELLARPSRKLAAGGLLLHSLLVSFAATDWIMSLVPEWHSAGFGLVYLVSCGLSALAVAILRMHPSEFPSADRGPTPILDDSLGRDLGNLLLTLTLLWAYVAFSQYLITWLGQLPDEIRFFVPRTEGHWRLLAWWLVASSFVIPFLSLLFRRVKDSPLLLRGICMIVLLGRILDQYWLVSP